MNNITLRDAPESLAGDSVGQLTASSTYSDQNELREAFRKLWRRKRIVIATVIILTLLAVVAMVAMNPKYTATSVILIDPRQPQVANVQAILGAGMSDTEAVLSEVEVLGSRQLIGKVVDKMGLVNNPEFNEDLQPLTFMSYLNPMRWIPASVLDAILGSEGALTPEQLKERIRNRVIDLILKKKLKIEEKTRTRVIEINFKSESRTVAMEAANNIADVYLVDQLEAKFEATERVTSWLNERLAELRKKVDASDRAVAEYRGRSGLVQSYRASTGVMAGKGVTLLEQQSADLSTQLTLARADRSAAEAKLRQVREAITKPGGEGGVAEVLDSQLIQHLTEQESELGRNIAQLGAQYGDRHPKMIAARAQLDDIRDKIQIEIKKIILGLENAANVARARENAIVSQLDELKHQLVSSNSAEVQLQALEMEADSNRTLMQTFLDQFKQASAQESGNIQTPDARIISRADLPEKPSFPKIPLFTAAAVVLSGLIGIVLAFIAEHLDRGFRSGVQFEQETLTPVLAMIPQVEESKGRPADYMVERPMSSYAEAVRSVYTNLLLTQGRDPLKTIVVSSCQPSEGKSTISVSLARMIAMSGHKVILVEADLRRPSIHNQLGIERGVGLAEVLIGSMTIDEAMFQDPKSSAHVLLAGKETLNPSKLMASHQMDELIAQLRIDYDAVIIDTAPVLAVSDGLLLANKADGTIYCCRWATTSRETSSLGLKVLREANARVVGAAITAVDTKKSRTYGYADTSYYYYAKKYYGE